MPSSFSESSSSKDRSSGSSSNSDNGSSGGRSLIIETPLSDRIMVALEAFQASIGGVEVGFSRCSHGLGFITLRVESSRVRRVTKLSLHSGGRF